MLIAVGRTRPEATSGTGLPADPVNQGVVRRAVRLSMNREVHGGTRLGGITLLVPRAGRLRRPGPTEAGPTGRRGLPARPAATSSAPTWPLINRAGRRIRDRGLREQTRDPPAHGTSFRRRRPRKSARLLTTASVAPTGRAERTRSPRAPVRRPAMPDHDAPSSPRASDLTTLNSDLRG